MTQIGERYFFVSRSGQQGHDQLRTLLGSFWTWNGGLFLENQTPEDKAYARSKELKRQIRNHLSKSKLLEKKVFFSAGFASQQKELRKYITTKHETPILSDQAYIFPKGTLNHLAVDSKWREDLYGKTEQGLMLYGNDIFLGGGETSEQLRKRGYSITAAIVEQAHEDRMDLVVKKIVERVQSTITMGQFWHHDWAFSFNRPVHRTIADKMNPSTFVKIASVKSHSQYEYFLENYEALAFHPGVPEVELPNTYLINMIKEVKDRLNNNPTKMLRLDKDAYDVVSLYKRIEREDISFRVARNDENVISQPRKIGNVKKNKGDATSNSAYMNYLDLWSKAHKELTIGELGAIQMKNSNILFSGESYDYFQQISSKGSNIPMTAKLEFSTPTTPVDRSIAELLRKGNFMTLFMLKAVEGNLEIESLNPKVLNLWQERAAADFYAQTYFLNNNDKVEVTTKPSLTTLEARSFDMLRFLDRLVTDGAESALDGTVPARSIVIHTGNEVSPFTTPGAARIGALILGGQIRKLVEEKMRTYEEILDGKESPTEILFYEIEKYRVNLNGSRGVVQRIFIPNFPTRDTIEFLDSQVKYDGVYIYKILAWTAVYGNSYKYSEFSAHGEEYKLTPHDTWRTWKTPVGKAGGIITNKVKRVDRHDGFSYSITNLPHLRLMRLPYYETEPIRIRDFPPISPHVNIIPYRGVSNRVLLNFMPGVDDHFTNPIALGTKDIPKITKYYESQHNSQIATTVNESLQETGIADVPIRFKSDDPPKFFEVYRIAFQPISWMDFEGSLRKTLSNDKNETSIVDTLLPNENYYYTFRSIDIHGNISNPTAIIKVRLSDDSGFQVIEPYDIDMNKSTNEEFKKPFRRLVQITPVLEQLVYKDERQANQQDTLANRTTIRLGVAEDTVYDKTFKVRFISKKSGKKIDFNVGFTHKHEKPPS